VNRIQHCLNAPAILLVVCPVLICTNVQATESTLATAAKNVTQIIAHRGASAERPECTLAAVQRATAVEIDVRTSQDGRLFFLLHDATLDRTTNGTGPANQLTLGQLQQLDAGSSFDSAWKDERIPSLAQVAQVCRGKIDLLLDLKEQGDAYDSKVADIIRQHGDPGRTILGVRTVDQAKRFRRLLTSVATTGTHSVAGNHRGFCGSWSRHHSPVAEVAGGRRWSGSTNSRRGNPVASKRQTGRN
jgi:glycerophosphoryl diester phosphodiesterase